MKKDKLEEIKEDTEEETFEDFQEKQSEEEAKNPGVNVLEMLNNPLLGEIMGKGKELFKKEKADPNVCEITIKAPSEVVLKLFKVE